MLFDLIVIGLGPAGLTAGIYALRYHLRSLLIGEVLGGELVNAARIENLPGFTSISGIEWADKVKKQLKNLGAQLVFDHVKIIKKEQSFFQIETQKEKQYQAKTLIVATGSERRRLRVPGEKQYLGKGVSYCPTCDAAFFQNKTVALIGGSDAAVSGALHLAEFAQKVYLIYRRDKLRAEPIWVAKWQKVEKSGKGKTIYNTNVVKILGDGVKVKAVKLDRPYQQKKTLNLDGVFIEIGGVPGTALLKPLGVKIDNDGYVQVDERMATNIDGLFCAFNQSIKSFSSGNYCYGSRCCCQRFSL